MTPEQRAFMYQMMSQYTASMAATPTGDSGLKNSTTLGQKTSLVLNCIVSSCEIVYLSDDVSEDIRIAMDHELWKYGIVWLINQHI